MTATSDGETVGADSVVARVAETARTTVAERAPEVDANREFPAEGIRALAASGGLGVVIPADFGGTGGALRMLADCCEEVARACGSTGLIFLMHNVTAATVAMGGGEAAGELLP